MRRLGQFLSLLLLLTAGVLWMAQSSSAKKSSEVTIRTTDDGPKKVSLDELTPLESEKYKVRDENGDKYYVTINKQHVGYSLAAIYDAAGVDYENVDFVEIARPDGGGFVRLEGKQLGPNYWDDGPVAIYYGKGGRLSFIRPLSNGVDSDSNAADNFELDGALTVRDRTGVPLGVEVTATPEKPKAGESVSFTATVEGGEGLTLKYDWSFSDGSSAEQDAATVSHTFDTPNAPVSAVVTVTTDHDDSKGEAGIALNVGKEEPKEDTSDTGGYSSGDPYSSGYGSYGGYTTPSYTDPGTDYSTPDSTGNSTPSKTEKEADVAQSEPTGTPVEGELLEDAAVPEGTSAPSSDTSNDVPEPTTPVSTVEQERSVPSSVLTGMAVVGLLGFGTFTELGSSGARRPSRLRRLNPFGRGKK